MSITSEHCITRERLLARLGKQPCTMLFALMESNLSRQRGFSLIELIIFIVIVSVGLVGILAALNLVTLHSADPLVRKQMLSIAEALLEEVESKQFTVCDPDDAAATTAMIPSDCTKKQVFGSNSLSSRGDFNNVGNYCDNSTPGGADQTSCPPMTLGTPGSSSGTIKDMTNTYAASPAGYWATISLDPNDAGLGSITLGGITSSPTADTLKVILITVEVHHYSSSETLKLQGYRTRWAPKAQSLSE